MKFSSQKGFTLLEVSIATAIAALGIMATLQMRAAQTQIDAARSVAQVYERLNSAAGNYMTIYYKDIINKARVSPLCGTPAYQIPTDGYFNAVDHGSDCKIELTVNGQKKIVNNYLQPKPSELAKLGLLTASDGRYEDQLPLPSFALAGGSASTSMVAYNTSLDPSFGAPYNPARNGMAILISTACIDKNCTTYEVRSLVYNIQPYSNIGDNATLLYRVMEAAGGGRTYLSDTRFGGILKADGGVSEWPNPIKMRNTSDGPPYILAMSNGYSLDDKNQFVRKDGSTPLTGDWNVGGQSITGINNLAASSATVTGALNAGSATVTGALNAGSATVTGGLSAGSVSAGTVYGNSVSGLTGVFGNFLGGARAALNATTAYFSGDVTTDGELTVAGASKLNSDLAVAGNTVLSGGTKVADFRIENEAVLGGACNPSTQTLSRASTNSSEYNNSLRLLVCDPDSSKWSTPQKDYGSSIDGLTNITSGLQVTTNNLSKKKLVVYTDVLTWQAATYDTNFPGRYQTVPNFQATGAGRTWVPTKFACNNGDMPPVLVSYDWVAEPNQTLVYNAGCKKGKWYFAMGPKERNIEYGNVCNSGLDSKLTNPVRDIYVPPYTTINYQQSDCISVNLVTPNFNANAITANVIVLRYE